VVEIREALAPADVEIARELFVEYERGLGVSLCFQGFDQELAGLPGDYAPPRGRLWIAFVDALPAACVALRPLAAGDAEMKRLYVKPQLRGHKLGRTLATLVIDAARELGYENLKLDTLPTMGEAQKLYASLGFVDAKPYNDNPIDGVRFMALKLGPGP